MNLRIGQGYDVHALKEGLPFVLGGVKLNHTKGCIAHSDGDVLVHAICDALLGAAAMGDIGQHFPDTSAKFEAIDSLLLLDRVVEMVGENGFEIVNLDATVVLQRPKIAPHILSMREVLSKRLKIDLSCVSVKATTSEQLGFEGREEGVSAQAVVLLNKPKF